MQKVRQGILSRKQVDDIGRNQTSHASNQKQEENKLVQKKSSLQNVAEHRRIVVEGTLDEKRQLQQETKQNYDFHSQARGNVLREVKNFDKCQDQVQLQHFKNFAQNMDQKQEVRKQYQKSIMEENKMLSQMKVERQKIEKFNVFNQEVNAYNQRHQKNLMDYL